MTLYLPSGLPAIAELHAEKLSVAARCQPLARPFRARPLKVGLVNLMPDKPTAERQIGRLLAAAGRPVELSLWLPRGLIGKSSSPDYLRRFYRRIEDPADLDLDAVIVTGAPVERLSFEEVTYWDELRRLFDWAVKRKVALTCICWAGQAALYHFHGIEKHLAEEKHFGLLPQQVLAPTHPLMAGLGPEILMPVSRHTSIASEAVIGKAGLRLLAASPESGPALVSDEERGLLCSFNHLEYEADTLSREYWRDRMAGLPIFPPRNLPLNAPEGCDAAWRRAGVRLFGNWLGRIRTRKPLAESLATRLPSLGNCLPKPRLESL